MARDDQVNSQRSWRGWQKNCVSFYNWNNPAIRGRTLSIIIWPVRPRERHTWNSRIRPGPSAMARKSGKKTTRSVKTAAVRVETIFGCRWQKVLLIFQNDHSKRTFRQRSFLPSWSVRCGTSSTTNFLSKGRKNSEKNSRHPQNRKLVSDYGRLVSASDDLLISLLFGFRTYCTFTLSLKIFSIHHGVIS